MFAGAARRILLPFYPVYIVKRTKEGCDRGSEVETVHNGRGGKGQFL